MEKIERNFKMRVGTGIIRQLSTAFYPDLTFVFDELVSNANDAFATKVKIYIGDDKITIEDNGEGMDENELRKFFYISHSSKAGIEEKIKGTMKRKIIGKFGIGKLSMYRLCRKFEIISWRNGAAYKAEFDFEELEKKEFVDDFELRIEPVGDFIPETESGTKIILSKLQPTGVTARDVKVSLIKRMPLAPDFAVYISGIGIAGEVQLESKDLIPTENIHTVEEYLPKIGPVKAKIAFLDSGRGKGQMESGIYIRVLGRIVPDKHINDEIDFRDITHGQQFYRIIMVEVIADGLGKVLLTNRNGFQTESEEYQALLKWLKIQIKKAVEKEFKSWQENSQNIEKTTIPELTEGFIKEMLSESPTSQKMMSSVIGVKRPRALSLKGKPEQSTPTSNKWESVLNANGLKFDVKTEEAGITEPEARFDKRSKTIYINILHPMYVFSRKHGKLTGALYHSLKAAMVCLALSSANNLKDFEFLYNDMTTGAGGMLNKVKLKRTKAALVSVPRKVR